MEINNKNDQSLVNQVEYRVYDDNKTLLDLSICRNTTIQVVYALKENLLKDISLIDYFKNLGFDIFNIKDSFFNDIFQPYSDSNNDIVLEDRIKEIYKNYSLCDDKCSYDEINTQSKTISCNCEVKTNLSLEQSILNLENFDEIEIDSNFGLIKCYNLVFSFKNKLKNIGFWILLFLILAQIPLLIIFFIKGIKPIREYLINEMIKYGYIDIKKNKKIKSSNEKNKENSSLKKDQKLNSPLKHKNSKLKNNSSIKNISPSEREIISQFNSINIISKDKKIGNDDKKLNKNTKNIINDNKNEDNKNINNKKKKKRKSKSKINNKILINNVILLKKPKKKN